MNVQFAELAAKGEMLLWGDVLIAEEDHQILGERARWISSMVRLEKRACEIDARDLRADDRGEFFRRQWFRKAGFRRRCADSGVPACWPASSCESPLIIRHDVSSGGS